MSQFDNLFRATYGTNPTPPPRPNGGLLDALVKAQQSQSVLGSVVPLQKVTPRPPQTLLGKVRVVKPKVFVSFDYENDRLYKQALDMWHANKKFDFSFRSFTPTEIQSENIGSIKAVLTSRVKQATHIVVLCGKYTNQRHADALSIGCTNWIQFECQQAMLYNKKIVAVLLQPGNLLPNNILGAQGIRVDSFNEAQIIAALSA